MQKFSQHLGDRAKIRVFALTEMAKTPTSSFVVAQDISVVLLASSERELERIFFWAGM